MAYDPQAERRRPRPDDNDPAPVDVLIGDAEGTPFGVADDPPPSPAVTPAPADPPPDRLLVNTGIAAAMGALVALLTARHFWKRRQERARADGSAGDPN